jgi:hypothetical protein
MVFRRNFSVGGEDRLEAELAMCHSIIGKLYENPKAILTVEEVDFIKRVLANHTAAK